MGAEERHQLSTKTLYGEYVSDVSRWDDPTWVFSNPTAGSVSFESTAYWNFDLPDGTCFTDPQWRSLLDAFKCLVHGLIYNRQKYKPIKPGYVSHLSYAIRYFVCWMVKNDYHSLEELDSASLEHYLEDLAREKSGNKQRSLITYVHLPILLSEQASVLSSASIPIFNFIPYGGRRSVDVVRDLTQKTSGEIPPVPDEVFLPITEKVVEFLESSGPLVVEFQRNLLNAVGEAKTRERHTTPGARREGNKAARLFYPQLFANPFGDVWSELAYKYGSPSRLLRHLILDTISACVIAIQAFVGIRISEVCGLSSYPENTVGLPACVEIQSSVSGLYDVFYIRGRIYKDETNWTEARWVAGMRPKGSDYLPPPVTAAILLHELLRPWRDLKQSSSLIVMFNLSIGLPLSPKGVSGANADLLNRGQKAWVERYVELPEKYENWSVTTHQWRKSFARYLVLVDKKMIRRLRLHFRHLSDAVTEQHYVGSDPELVEFIREAAVQEASWLIDQYISGQADFAGPMRKVLEERAPHIRTYLYEVNEDERHDVISDMVRVNRLQISSCDWGYCFFRPETSRCNRHLGDLQLFTAHPDLARRSPSTCCECANLAVSAEHIDFWRARYEKWRDAYEEYVNADLEGAAMYAEEKREQSLRILNDLKDHENAEEEP